MRLGIFGGTFDPPHVGHLLAASDAYEALALDRMLFVPAHVQPLKEDATTTTAALRVRMTQQLVEGDARFTVDTIEVEREGVSFMVDTLRAIRARHPAAALHLILGLDVLETFSRWREPEEVLRLAQLVLVRRPGFDHPEGVAALAQLATQAGAARPRVLETRVVDVSSTEIRARVRAGLPIRGYVPDSVAALIASAGLYR